MQQTSATRTTPGEDDANKASKVETSIKALDKEVEKIIDIKILSDKTEKRAGQEISAGVPGSVMSDSEKAGTANTTLEDGELGVIVAPMKKEESKDTSANQIEARILGHGVEEGRGTKMSGYNAEQPAEILSVKAREHNLKTMTFENSMKVLSEKVEEHQVNKRKILGIEAEESATKTTPEIGEEGFEGPPCRQSLEEKETASKVDDEDSGQTKIKEFERFRYADKT